MTPDQRATAPAGMQRNAILSARAIGFMEFGDGHFPTFSRRDLVPGTADCRRCGKVITVVQFLVEECFVGPSTMCDAASGGA